jgi:hypothetical protein
VARVTKADRAALQAAAAEGAREARVDRLWSALLEAAGVGAEGESRVTFEGASALEAKCWSGSGAWLGRWRAEEGAGGEVLTRRLPEREVEVKLALTEYEASVLLGALADREAEGAEADSAAAEALRLAVSAALPEAWR